MPIFSKTHNQSNTALENTYFCISPIQSVLVLQNAIVAYFATGKNKFKMYFNEKNF